MVKCADCGFLALRNEFTGLLDEADNSFRLTGERPTLRKPNYPQSSSLFASPFEYPHRLAPICFAMAFDLLDEHLKTGPDYGQMGVSSEIALEIISKERECAAFTKWQQGSTPKEHREMLDRQWRLEQEEKTRLAVWQREDRRDKDAEDRHKDQMATLRNQHRWQLFWFGFAIVIATVVGSMIQAAWFARPW